jgi:hypothetical protein
MKRSHAALAFGVIALLSLHLFLGLTAVSRQSVTVDEIFHVTGGFFFNRLGDYRVHPENGVLPQRVQALPSALAGANPPPIRPRGRTTRGGVKTPHRCSATIFFMKAATITGRCS